jgi:hypothetical protein
MGDLERAALFLFGIGSKHHTGAYRLDCSNKKGSLEAGSY